VEVGGGPSPLIGSAGWARAIAVDPLAEGYEAEGLFQPLVERTEGLASAGESIPLNDGIADVVVIENCVDHVENPVAVMGELARLCRPDGYLWLLVDLKETVDRLHPHAFDREGVRRLVKRAGFRIERERESRGHASHPDAESELRVLARRGRARDG